MPPRYTLGLNLENEDDYQGGLSRAVEEALLPSVSQEVAPASEPAYSFDGPKINLGELQDSTPAATEDTAAETNYLAQLMGQANEVKALREKASTLAAQELSPEQSIASAILSAVPALLGLAAAGKRGFVGAGSVSGPAGALYAEARRKDMLEQSRQVGSQADALQQALQLGIKERGAEDRLTRTLTARDESLNKTLNSYEQRAEAREKARIEEEKRKFETEQSVKDVKGLKRPSLVSKEEYEEAKKASTEYPVLFKQVDDLELKWDKLSDQEKASKLQQIVLTAKGDYINKGGAAFSALENQLNRAGLPSVVTLAELSKEEFLKTISGKINKLDPKDLLSSYREAYLGRYLEKIGRYEIDPEGSLKRYMPILEKMKNEESEYEKMIAARYGKTANTELANKYGKDAANVFGKVGVTVGR